MSCEDLEILYVPAVARLAGKTADAIYQMRRRGRIPLRKIGRGEWGMLRRDYVRWVRGELDPPDDEVAPTPRGGKYVRVLASRERGA